MERPLEGREDGQQFVVSHTEKGAAQRGYPTTEVTWGPRTLDELTADITPGNIASRTRLGKAAAEIVLKQSGVILCRLHNTVIAKINANGCLWLNTGGWNTVTTYRHMEKFAGRHNFNIKVGGNKKAGGNTVTWYREEWNGKEWPNPITATFTQKVSLCLDGTTDSDLDG